LCSTETLGADDEPGAPMTEAERHLRPRDGSEQPTTPVELLFDLVYVIAVTQLSRLVIDGHIALVAVAQAGFLLLVVWWAWIYTFCAVSPVC
jgi:low temperature requirement protein LtrA